MEKAALKEKSRKLLWCIVGNGILGLGVGLAKLAGLGNDSFNGSCMAVSSYFGIAYTTYAICYNCFLFIFELLFGRKMIGVGTFVNWFLISYAAEFFSGLLGQACAGLTGSFGGQLALLAVSVVVSGLGLAIYQVCDAGVAPYDAIPLMICRKHPKLKFFWVRIALDGAGVILILVFGGIASIGTLVMTFGLGPVAHLFMEGIRRLEGHKKAAA